MAVLKVLFETENGSGIASAKLWSQTDTMTGVSYFIIGPDSQLAFRDFSQAKFALLALLCDRASVLQQMEDYKTLRALRKDIERLYKLEESDMVRNYRATVIRKGEKVDVILETCMVLGGNWRIGHKKPSGSYAGWRGCTEIFESRTECQKRLDAEALKRGFVEVE